MTLQDLVDFPCNNLPLVIAGLAMPIVIYGLFKCDIDLIRDMGREIEDLYNRYIN